MQTRIYKVNCDLEGHKSPRLIEAPSLSAAIRHCTAKHYSAAPVSTKDLADLMRKGVQVEAAVAPVEAPAVEA